MNAYFNAKLTDYKTIMVFIFSDFSKPENTPIEMIINGKEQVKLDIVKKSFLNGLELFECKYYDGIKLGNDYVLYIDSFGFCALNVSQAINFPNFDEDYFYSGDDLGFTYSKDSTTWKLWAPLATKVDLILTDRNDNIITKRMERGLKGVYSLKLKGNFECYKYHFEVTNNGITKRCTDPYGISSNANGVENYVINLEKLEFDTNDSSLTPYCEYYENTIYELHVRDFTIDNHTNIEHKGKFLGLTETGKKTIGGHKCGIDYLKALNITHVQLMPIYDYKTVDELNPDKTYNWGYDPQQYFVPEGSYSTNPDDPYARLIECKKMIAAFHKAGISVIMDVVFNHVYDYQLSSFEACVPGYYFRKLSNGFLAKDSGCGNELDSERKMVRKLIVDACKFWVKVYHIDGYRFDLMGLIDSDTIDKAHRECKKIKKQFMIYGEGWNMGNSLPEERRASMNNAYKMPYCGFFNDMYRDLIGGKAKNETLRGYPEGNFELVERFKFLLLGSFNDFGISKKFINPNQSVNYVECHDDDTLYDRITKYIPNINQNKVFKLINLVNAIIAISFGISLYHQGQEIGLSKFGHDNTYNEGDKFNKFDWSLLDKRYEMFLYLSSILKFRKNYVKLVDLESTKDNNYFFDYGQGVIGFEVRYLSVGKILFVINASNNDFSLDLNKYEKIIIGNAGYLENSDLFMQNHLVSAHSVEGILIDE